jgi:hypothetical protein
MGYETLKIDYREHYKKYQQSGECMPSEKTAPRREQHSSHLIPLRKMATSKEHYLHKL